MALLPEIPKVELDIVADRSEEREGFLHLKRYDVVVVDGAKRSAAFPYDLVERHALDAAVIAAHHIGPDGTPHVYLRTAIRPPIALSPRLFNPAEGSPPKASRPTSVLWELPAGLIEPGEVPTVGAARELEEELGFSVDPEKLEPLGANMFPAPAFIAESHWFFHIRVDPALRREPGGDGSPLEEAAKIVSVPLETALAACRMGEIRDSKTELALFRLHAILAT